MEEKERAALLSLSLYLSLSLSLSLYLLNQFNCGRTKEGRKEGVLSSSRQKKSLFVSVDWTPLAPIEGWTGGDWGLGRNWWARIAAFPQREKGSAHRPVF